MSNRVQNHSLCRRIASTVAMIGLLALVSGCVQTKKLGGEAAAVEGRPISVLRNPAVPMQVGTDLNAGYVDTGSIGLDLAVSLVDTTLKAATGTYEKSAKVMSPSFDPTKIVEEKLVAGLAARYRTSSRGGLSLPLKTVGSNEGWPDKNRVTAIVAGAKSRGFDGLVLDVVPTRYAAVTDGHGLSLGGAKVEFIYLAKFALIDAASGKLLASGHCSATSRANIHKLDAVLAGGQNLVNAQFSRIAKQCADDMGKALSGA